MLLEVVFKLGNADAIDSGSAFVLDHPLIGKLQVAAFAHGVHQPACLLQLRFRPQTGRHVSLGARQGHTGVPRRYLLCRCPLAVVLLSSSTVRVVPPPTRGFQCSALRSILAPTMASADFCMSLPTPFDAGSTEVALGTHADLPGYDAPTFTLMPVGFTSQRSVQVSGFDDICRLTPPCRLYPLPVRQASALPSASSRFAVARDTLAVRLTLPLAGRVEDFHLQVSAPCRAHNEKARLI